MPFEYKLVTADKIFMANPREKKLTVVDDTGVTHNAHYHARTNEVRACLFLHPPTPGVIPVIAEKLNRATTPIDAIVDVTSPHPQGGNTKVSVDAESAHAVVRTPSNNVSLGVSFSPSTPALHVEAASANHSLATHTDYDGETTEHVSFFRGGVRKATTTFTNAQIVYNSRRFGSTVALKSKPNQGSRTTVYRSKNDELAFRPGLGGTHKTSFAYNRGKIIHNESARTHAPYNIQRAAIVDSSRIYQVDIEEEDPTTGTTFTENFSL